MNTFKRERWSKWDVVCMMSRELNLPMDHVTEVTSFSPAFKSTVSFFLSLQNVIEVAGPSGGTARPRDVEMTRTRLEEKGIGCHRDFTEGFLQSVQPFL